MNWQTLLDSALTYVLPVVVIPLIVRYVLPLIIPGTTNLFDWVKSKAGDAKTSYFNGLLQRLIDLAKSQVLAFENTFIEDLKDKVVAGVVKPEEIPGILTAEKDKFLAALKEKATVQGIWELVKTVVFASDEPAFMKWVETMVEGLVSTLPPSGLQTSKVPGQFSAVQIAVGKALAVANTPVVPAVPPPAAV